MTTYYLLDNSVLQRITRDEVERGLVALTADRGLLAVSDASVLEAGYSATSADDHRRWIRRLTQGMVHLGASAVTGRIALALQTALFAAGMGRSAGVIDLLHAATAIEHDAVVVHYDSDFEYLAEVEPRLRHQWIVPRGQIA